MLPFFLNGGSTLLAFFMLFVAILNLLVLAFVCEVALRMAEHRHQAEMMWKFDRMLVYVRFCAP